MDRLRTRRVPGRPATAGPEWADRRSPGPLLACRAGAGSARCRRTARPCCRAQGHRRPRSKVSGEAPSASTTSQPQPILGNALASTVADATRSQQVMRMGHAGGPAQSVRPAAEPQRTYCTLTVVVSEPGCLQLGVVREVLDPVESVGWPAFPPAMGRAALLAQSRVRAGCRDQVNIRCDVRQAVERVSPLTRCRKDDISHNNIDEGIPDHDDPENGINLACRAIVQRHQ